MSELISASLAHPAAKDAFKVRQIEAKNTDDQIELFNPTAGQAWAHARTAGLLKRQNRLEMDDVNKWAIKAPILVVLDRAFHSLGISAPLSGGIASFFTANEEF